MPSRLTRLPHGALCIAVGDHRAASSRPRGSVSPAHHEAASLLVARHTEPVSLTVCSPTTLPVSWVAGLGSTEPHNGSQGGEQ